MKHFSVSVIIPVYNSEHFIEKAITSVLEQPEVTEIVVVNDGSTDGTQDILDTLQQKNSIIKTYGHENNSNKGRSASRNLGIKMASESYVAFLDADDFYLPNRFVNDKKIFRSNEACDGVYNAVGFHFYKSIANDELDKFELYTVRQKVKPENLFEGLISGKFGHFQIDGLTVKRSVFDITGLFNEYLEVAEDTDIFWKLALKCRLETGIINKPLAKRGVHDNNVFNQKELYNIYTIKMYESLVIWSYNNGIKFAMIDLLLDWLWIWKYKENNKLYQDIGYWFKLFILHPRMLFSLLSIKYFPIIRLRQKLFPFLYVKNKINKSNKR